MALDHKEKPGAQFPAVGIDIGSTTTKVVVMEPQSGDVLFSQYKRHHADQSASVRRILDELDAKFPEQAFRFCFTGSGTKPLAEGLDVPFVQEVAANAAALQYDYQAVGSAIELGGQDAKMIFSARTNRPGSTRSRTCA